MSGKEMIAFCTNCDNEAEDILEVCPICGCLCSYIYTPEYLEKEFETVDPETIQSDPDKNKIDYEFEYGDDEYGGEGNE